MDTIGDFLTRLRNALKARHKYVIVPASNLKFAMSEILREQVAATEMLTIEFEVNPGYVHELKAAMARSWT